ncbi:MAG TPA: hypothetical protein VK284_09505 [Streptosporangiaceae bacterium]|jgi:hypothetical protein|nr:hypothetical protein [Streptosporangiaceae bacterium]
MPATPPPEIKTELTDRALLVHILEHVEAMWAELDEFRPLLAMIKRPNGTPDMIGLLQARRDARKAARGGP